MKALKISIFTVFIINIILLVACEKHAEDHPAAQGLARTPVSSMGQAVGAAKNLSRDADQRNSELDRQAKELTDVK